MIVILDNGHGVDTAGKRSPLWPDGSQLFEYEFNRDIVKRIAVKIPECFVLVPELTDVSLKTRVDRCNLIASRNKSKGCLLLSIHANAGGGTGWEAYTTGGVTSSDKYATMLYEEAKLILPQFTIRKDVSDGDPDKEAPFYIIKNTMCPAVLTENLFMDSKRDCRFIMSEEGRSAIAQIHINFIRKINV